MNLFALIYSKNVIKVVAVKERKNNLGRSRQNSGTKHRLIIQSREKRKKNPKYSDYFTLSARIFLHMKIIPVQYCKSIFRMEQLKWCKKNVGVLCDEYSH